MVLQLRLQSSYAALDLRSQRLYALLFAAHKLKETLRLVCQLQQHIRIQASPFWDVDCSRRIVQFVSTRFKFPGLVSSPAVLFTE